MHPVGLRLRLGRGYATAWRCALVSVCLLLAEGSTIRGAMRVRIAYGIGNAWVMQGLVTNL